MAAPTDTLEGKAEFAILAVLSDAGLEELAMLVCGHEFEEQEGAQVQVACFSGPEMVPNSGNYMLRTRIAVRSAMDPEPDVESDLDPREKHRQIVQSVREAIFVEDIAEALSGHEDDFTCNAVWAGDTEATVEDRFFVTTLELEVDCVRTDVA